MTDLRPAAEASGWALPVRLWQPHNPAFWLYASLTALGVFLWSRALLQTHVAPSTLLVAVLLQALYALPFVWFITRADYYEREPAKLCALAFLWGGLVSTWVMSAPANSAVLSLYGKLVGIDFALAWGPALTAPFTEETAKLTGVVIMLLIARQHVRSVYDGMLLGMFVGLGFQVFENVKYLSSYAETNFSSSPLTDMLFVFVMRGISGIWGHWLFSGIAGAGVGYFIGATDQSLARRVVVASAFILFAMLCHGLFDAGGGIGLMGMGIAIPLMIFGIVVAWIFAGRRARDWMRALLQHDADAGNVTEAELALLAGPQRDRRRHLRAIRRAQGKPAALNCKKVLRTATELARAIAATNSPLSREAEAVRAQLARVRTAGGARPAAPPSL